MIGLHVANRATVRPVIDCTHPNTFHEHGTANAYRRDSCRCEPCTAANTAMALELRMRRARQAWAGETTFVDTTGPARRMQALGAAGWSARELAPHLGMSKHAVDQLRREFRTSVRGRCLASTATRIRTVYDALWWQTPTGRPSAVERSATWGRKHGYAEPWRWEGRDIDDPAATPLPLETPLDEVAIDLAIGGQIRLPAGPERTETIRRLAATGRTDREIAARVGLSGDAVGKIRGRAGIPAGVTTAQQRSVA